MAWHQLLSYFTFLVVSRSSRFLCAAHQVVLQQPEAAPAPAEPASPLPWSDFNVLHTTDTHGWLRGHMGTNDPERSFSGDWGDLFSFASHLQNIAVARSSDLLLVDSGDLHDGNGLTDRDPGVRGTIASNIMHSLPYDVMTVGNHELYNYSIALDFHKRFVPQLEGRYLASNVYIDLPDSSTVRFAAPYRRFKTAVHKKRVLAFGTLFNFTYSAPQIRVQSVVDMVQEPWFLDCLRESRNQTDVVLLAGHMAAYDADWRVLHKAVRKVLPTTPILIFAGHAHERDCFVLDDKSMILASGRYMETVGWMSVDLADSRVPIERRYLDQNRRTYMYHSNMAEEEFDTIGGLAISRNLTYWSNALNLSYVFGHAPHPYYLSRYPYTSPLSIFSLLLKDIFPKMITRPDRRHPQPLMILNSGSARFDISSGPFTTDGQSLVFPFINRNLFVPDVPASVAKRVVESMNEVGEYAHLQAFYEEQRRQPKGSIDSLSMLQQLEDEVQHLRLRQSLAAPSSSIGDSNSAASQDQKLTFGYVTLDLCPGIGDDTAHVPLPYFEPPVFVATVWDESSETVDVAFFDFIAPMVVDALNRVQDEKKFHMSDVQLYTDVRSDTMLGEYAQKYWS